MCNAIDEFKRTKLETIHLGYTEYAKLVLGNIFLLNGGGAVALLAFLGDVGANQPAGVVVNVADANDAIIVFAFGALYASIASVAAYFVETIRYHRVSRNTDINFWLGWAPFFPASASGLSFVLGCFVAIGIDLPSWIGWITPLTWFGWFGA
jgi:hypothetical protein